jgi:hypothetical protein
MTDRLGALRRTVSLCQTTKFESSTGLIIPLSFFFFCSYSKLALPALAWASLPSHPFVEKVLAALKETKSLSPGLKSPRRYAMNCKAYQDIQYRVWGEGILQ